MRRGVAARGASAKAFRRALRRRDAGHAIAFVEARPDEVRGEGASARFDSAPEAIRRDLRLRHSSQPFMRRIGDARRDAAAGTSDALAWTRLARRVHGVDRGGRHGIDDALRPRRVGSDP